MTVSPRRALAEDLRRYTVGPDGRPVRSFRRWRRLILRPEAWILCSFRFGSWIYGRAPGPLSAPLRLLWRPFNGVISTMFDTHIGVTAQIGPGLFLGHYGGIWVNPSATLGGYCNLSPGVIIGAAGPGMGRGKMPVIGERVWIGPHAVVSGPVRVGDHAVIGANSLVVADVPENAVVLGVPSRILSYSGSHQLIRIPDAAPKKPAPPATAPLA